MRQTGIARADFIEGLAKGLAVLESFDTERQRLNATQAGERAGLTRAAARRHLLTLADLGYLESDGRHYWLSPKVLRLSGSYLASSRLPRLVQPTLNRLALVARESFSVAVLDGEEVVIVARSASPQAQRLVPYGLHLGTRMPAHATSTGRILLAAMRPQAFAEWMKGRELQRLTPMTAIDPRSLRAAVAQVRQEDLAVVREEHELGVLALAVPLRNMKGSTLAALNVVVSPDRMDAVQLKSELLPLLLEASRELRSLL
ncbi:MAG: helix-turn-helix domain-containing protein [Hydrogenophaga sp.]|uniref:IclR family transcriptional regulator domain-containing protein n=1 Tax=Hydrogenophaga sp. TaxID=1904254 RepID=UPI001D8326A6|nr:IclR family transcriptional regulator C-terminal domain-containing protein [Hydrogenophaga sp.]MBX3611509.1 helix-turn-helix domain-containing protein [Hydrogenophaga sp.]